MKGENPRRWSSEVKRLSGMTSSEGNVESKIDVDGFNSLPKHEKANRINEAFLEPLQQYRLTAPLTKLPLEEHPVFLQISEFKVAQSLKTLNPAKSTGPDNIPNWLPREFSELIAFPIMQIINHPIVSKNYKISGKWPMCPLHRN